VNAVITSHPRRFTWQRARVLLLTAMVVAGAGTVLVRAWHLQIYQGDELRGLAEEQYLRQISLKPRRGTIYDRNGAELAVSVEADSVWANPRAMRKAGLDMGQVAIELASALGLEPGAVTRRLDKDRYFSWIARRVLPKQAAAVRALHIPGVSLVAETRRYYPNRELASHLLGYVDVDGIGIDGLEMQLNEQLHGSSASVPAILDGRRSVVFSDHLLDDRAARGDDVYLTIDKTIQYHAERELALAVSTYEAKAGSVVVLDPRTGELLALANFPTFNPNDPSAFSESSRRNRAVTDRFEPGSTTKVFTVAGALSSGAIRTDQQIDCQGPLRVGDHVIHDTKPWEWLRPAQVLAYSSNIGAAKIGMALGREGLFRTLRRFGFGEPTGLNLPGETGGILRHYRRWYEMDAASISFGQGMSVTTAQLAVAMGAIANRGTLMKPMLVRRIAAADGQKVDESAPEARRRAVPAAIAALVTEMMTGVTEENGTAHLAALEGFSVAGKTGTAQKADYVHGGYTKDQWIASFVGFVPARNPRLVIAVVLDEPLIAHQGGMVAAPVFRRVAQTALRHIGLSARGEATALAERLSPRAPSAAEPRAGTRAPAQSAPGAERAKATSDKTRVPNLVGLSARAAFVTLRRAGLWGRLEGTGLTAWQEPEPDTSVTPGTEVQVVLQPVDSRPHRASWNVLAAESEAERGSRAGQRGDVL
jgi:cell division protein FtsI (penicillin-binding protein 3)